ncbi:hypothetical protein [Streptomyces sp. NPDC088261]|uniref:hypothetical protein n=1 Tax=Streptomyces sp. NPDC088261 TaxID=3365851 RepID=UPI00380E1CEE
MPQAEPLARPQFHPYAAIPALVPLRTAARAGDLPAVESFFDGLTDEDDRAYASALLADLTGTEKLFERIEAEGSDAPLPRTLLAHRQVVIGWNIRSGARAQHVSRRQFDQFHAWLRKAEQLLIDVCAEHPEFALAWSVRLTTARGLELGQSEARRRYDRLAEHHPHHLAAQNSLLQQLCPKWGGTWEAAHGFARERAAAAPAGSDAGVLVAAVHIEHWLDLPSGDDARYLTSADVRDELVAAAAASVLHPGHRPTFRSVEAHNHFAMVFSTAGEHALAAPHFRAIGNNATERPWTYLGDQDAAFTKHRTLALAKG